jgi:hypothetical protein
MNKQEQILVAQIERAPAVLRSHVRHLQERVVSLEHLLSEQAAGTGPSAFSYQDIRSAGYPTTAARFMLPKFASLSVFAGDRDHALELSTTRDDEHVLVVRATRSLISVRPRSANSVHIVAREL